MNGVEDPVRSEAEGLGDNEDDLPIMAMPPSVACLMPEDNGSSRESSLKNAR